MPIAASVARAVNSFVVDVLDSFMMMILLSFRSDSSIGMSHHLSFGKFLSGGVLPLIGAKFRHIALEHPVRFLFRSPLSPSVGLGRFFGHPPINKPAR